VPANSLPESQYLLHAGSDRVGALDVRASIHDGPTPGNGAPHALEYLMEAAERIEDGLPIPAHLEAIFIDGSALGGARPKASVRDEHGVLWLAKFSSRRDGFDVPAIECAALRLAAAAGLTVPPVEVRRLGARKVMFIRRFDRCWAKPGETPGANDDLMATQPGQGRVEHRLAFVSGLTLVGCDETESRTKAYTDLAQAVRSHCHPGVIRADNAELFKRMVYNILVSNDDDHLRNHAAFWDGRTLSLTPAYDLAPQIRNSETSSQAIAITRDGLRASQLRLVRAAASEFHIDPPRANEIIDRLRASIETHWDDCADLAQLTKAERAFLRGRQFLNRYINDEQA
jgi:serine/threonine-protein kinase HipA